MAFDGDHAQDHGGGQVLDPHDHGGVPFVGCQPVIVPVVVGLVLAEVFPNAEKPNNVFFHRMLQLVEQFFAPGQHLVLGSLGQQLAHPLHVGLVS